MADVEPACPNCGRVGDLLATLTSDAPLCWDNDNPGDVIPVVSEVGGYEWTGQIWCGYCSASIERDEITA